MPPAEIYYLTKSFNDLPPHNDWLAVSEREILQRFRVLKRRVEWRLGRWTAKRLIAGYLQQIDRRASVHEIVIRAAADGAPEAFLRDRPLPITLSISHSADTAFCVLDPMQHPTGCDVERIEPRTPEFVEDYFTRAEREMLQEVAAADYDLFATMIWSAKESALKALREGLRADTRSVEIYFASSGRASTWKPLGMRCAGRAARFDGRWRCGQDFVFAVVVQGEIGRLVRLDSGTDL